MNVWVDVKDRLPTGAMDVLVYCSDTKEQFVAFKTKEAGLFQYAQDRHGESIVCRPTHWSYLQDGPK